MKRLLSCYASDMVGATKEELKQSILSSEGRIIMGETVGHSGSLDCRGDQCGDDGCFWLRPLGAQ